MCSRSSFLFLYLDLETVYSVIVNRTFITKFPIGCNMNKVIKTVHIWFTSKCLPCCNGSSVTSGLLDLIKEVQNNTSKVSSPKNACNYNLDDTAKRPFRCSTPTLYGNVIMESQLLEMTSKVNSMTPN